VTTDCGDGHCVTCSDEAVPLTVDSVLGDGTVLCGGGTEVMTDLVGAVHPGDVVLVHAGVAIQRAERPEDVTQ
jgi:hydrogenase expression/formation protein HypC